MNWPMKWESYFTKQDFMISRGVELQKCTKVVGRVFFSRGGEVVKDERTPRALPSANA